ncbi:hypothetical protein [Intrasporangium sp.]|uniref:hypothetical protein n=1 Tax=Intrasporangium sp. TaxID=1925024 RepID=UPI003221972F
MPTHHNPRRASLRRLRRLLVLLVLTIGAGLVCAPSASAAPAAPAAPATMTRTPALPTAPWDCKDAPVPAMPDTGLPGFLDPAPTPPPPAGDPWAHPATSSIYEQYGYAGLAWNTYDLGCLGAAGDLSASVDTFLGNAFLSAATSIAAATNGLHNKIAHPQQYMAPLDQVVATVTHRLREAIWSPWGALALLGVAVLLLGYSLHGRLSAIVSATAWALLVLAVLSGISAYPTRVASFFDHTVTTTIGTVNQASAGIAKPQPGTDPTRAQGALLVDCILYDAWLRGQLGDTTSPAATKWGPVLYREAAFSRAEANTAAATPGGVKKMTEQKQGDWVATTSQIQDADPAAYAQLQGKAQGRAGTGLLALLGVAFTALFRLVADLFLFTGLVMLRLLVMFFPAAAVIGIIAPMSAIVRRIGNMAGASIINVTAFGIGAAVHTVLVSAILTHATSLGSGILALILCLVVTAAAFILLLPLLSLTNLLGRPAGHGNRLLRGLRRAGTDYLIGRTATRDGIEHADQPTPDPSPEQAGRYPREDRPARDVTRTNLPLEAFSRPPDDPPAVVTEQAPIPQTQRSVGAGHVSRGALGAAEAESVEGRQAINQEPVAAATSESRASREQFYDPANSPRRGSALVGVLVDEVPPGTRDASVVTRHDSNDEITSEGIVQRFYDPATKTLVRAEDLQAGERHD